MEAETLLYSLGIWIVFYAIAVFIGYVVQAIVGFGADASTMYWLYIFILIALILSLTYVMMERMDISFFLEDKIAVGVLWVILTLIVGFFFGLPWGGRYWHYAFAPPASPLGSGDLLVLLSELVAPLFVGFVVEH